MSNELQTLNERIAERIGKDLVDLIPADQWQEMVDTEIIKFKRETAPRIIQDLLKDAFKKEAIKTIDDLTCTSDWNEITGQYTNTKLKQLLADSGGEIFAGVMHPAMQMVMQDLRSRLPSY